MRAHGENERQAEGLWLPSPISIGVAHAHLLSSWSWHLRAQEKWAKSGLRAERPLSCSTDLWETETNKFGLICYTARANWYKCMRDGMHPVSGEVPFKVWVKFEGHSLLKVIAYLSDASFSWYSYNLIQMNIYKFINRWIAERLSLVWEINKSTSESVKTALVRHVIHLSQPSSLQNHAQG